MSLSLLRRPFYQRRLESFVERIASRSQVAVWQRVRHRVTEMSRSQARGYIRARAALVIQRELAIAAAEEPALSRAFASDIQQSVEGRVIRQTLFDAMRDQRGELLRRRAA